jgi:hypothetical protein
VAKRYSALSTWLSFVILLSTCSLQRIFISRQKLWSCRTNNEPQQIILKVVFACINGEGDGDVRGNGDGDKEIWKIRRDCRPSDSTVSEDAGIEPRSPIIANCTCTAKIRR